MQNVQLCRGVDFLATIVLHRKLLPLLFRVVVVEQARFGLTPHRVCNYRVKPGWKLISREEVDL